MAPAVNLIKSANIPGDMPAPLLYRGVGLLTDPANPLVLEILIARFTSYNVNLAITEYPHANGRQTVMIAGLQVRKNARAVSSVSLEFFSDEFFTAQVETKGEKVTNDGNAILKEITVRHPAAKTMIERARTQDKEVGFGTTLVMVTAA